MTGCDFGDALKAFRNGDRCTRAGWNGKGQWVAFAAPGIDDPMTLPYLFLHTVGGQAVPWTASQTDILATDWEILS